MLSGAIAQIQQRHALAGRGEQRPLHRVAEGLDAQRIARDQHVPDGVEEHQAVRAIDPAIDVSPQVDQRGVAIARQLVADLVHQDFGIGLAGQVIVAIGQQIAAEPLIIGQLPIEGKAEPLMPLQMMPLEGLGVAPILGPAGGIADVADRGPAGVFVHQAFALAAMAKAKDLADAPQFLVGVDQLVALGIERRHAGRKLAAILNIQQHPRHQPRGLFGTLLGAQRAGSPARQVIDRRDAALVVQFAHR